MENVVPSDQLNEAAYPMSTSKSKYELSSMLQVYIWIFRVYFQWKIHNKQYRFINDLCGCFSGYEPITV